MRVRPLHDHVIVKRETEETQSVGGIFIPAGAAERPSTGIVVAFGVGRTLENGTLIPIDVKLEDRVIFGKHAGSEVKIDGEEYLVLSEDDILAVL